MIHRLLRSVLTALPTGALIRLSRVLPSPLAYRLEFAADAARWAPRAAFDAAVPFGRARIRSSLEEHNDRRFALHWTNSLAGLATASVVVQPGDTVFELGANVGTETLALSALAGASGRVVAVEPSERCATMVAQRLASNGIENVTLVLAAVAAASGSVGFEEATDGNSGVGHVSGWSPEAKTGAIEAITLDSLLTHGTPAFIFMDIEGAECHALLGGAQTLARVRPVIFAEVNGPALQRMGTSTAQFCAVAAKHRYLVFDANAKGQPPFVPDSAGNDFTDVILLPEERESTIHAIRRRLLLYKLFPWLLGRNRVGAKPAPARAGTIATQRASAALGEEGILYVAFGERWRAEARDSIRSLRRVSALPVAVVTDTPWQGDPQPDVFVKRHDGGGFGVKPRHIFDATPFERTLFLDTDTRVMQDPAPAFGLLRYYDIGVRFGGPQLNEEPGLMFHTQCNSGVILFRRCEQVTQVGQLWLQEYAQGLASHGQGDDPRGLGDQRYLAIAIAKSRARPVHLAEYMNFALFESIVAYSPLVVVHGHQRDIELIGQEINSRWDARRDWHARVWLSNIEGLLPAGIRRSDPLLAMALLLRRLANRLRRRLRR